MKILLVEDDKLTVESIRLCIEYYLPESILEIAFNGTEALASLSGESFDAVLMDMGLPDISGMEVLKRLRQSSDTPVFVISALNDKETISLAYANGANDYITKPFRHAAIIDRLKTIKSSIHSC